jgi:hypothetical protein
MKIPPILKSSKSEKAVFCVSMFYVCPLSLFQNPVGFGTSSWKKRLDARFSLKSKEAVSKLEVLKQPPF